MSQNDVTRILVGNITVGIIGLKAVLENIALDYMGKSDCEIINALLDALEKNNYICDTSREKYGRAFLKEFRKFLGEPVKDENQKGIYIKVLGSGCPQCDRFEQELIEVMNETGIEAELEHVRDPIEIGEYGVMGTPALVINGKVKAVGSVPLRSKLIQCLKDEQENIKRR